MYSAPAEIIKYLKSLDADRMAIKKSFYELVAYSEGGISPESAKTMSYGERKLAHDIIVDKINNENGAQEML